MTRAFAVSALLVVGAVGIAGPGGLFALSKNSRLLTEREADLAELTAKRDELRTRVDLLDPRHADPDLVGELLRSKLNVAHPDEMVVDRP